MNKEMVLGHKPSWPSKYNFSCSSDPRPSSQGEEQSPLSCNFSKTGQINCPPKHLFLSVDCQKCWSNSFRYRSPMPGKINPNSGLQSHAVLVEGEKGKERKPSLGLGSYIFSLFWAVFVRALMLFHKVIMDLFQELHTIFWRVMRHKFSVPFLLCILYSSHKISAIKATLMFCKRKQHNSLVLNRAFGSISMFSSVK